jgi:hypothetical protein
MAAIRLHDTRSGELRELGREAGDAFEGPELVRVEQ